MLQALIVLSVGALVGLDQWTKWLASTYLRDGSIPLWADVFHLTYVENRGAAWGIGQGGRWVFVVVTSLVVIGLLWMLLCGRFRRQGWILAAGTLIVAGGIGNLIDRVWNGFVVDFFDFCLINFPVFNVADCCVVVGGILMMISVLFIYKEPFKQAGKEGTDGAGDVDCTARDGGTADRPMAAGGALGDAIDGAEMASAGPRDDRGDTADETFPSA